MQSDDQTLSTQMLNLNRAEPMEERPTRPLDRKIPHMLEFYLLGTDAVIDTLAREQLFLGRRDRHSSALQADVDLTPYGAQELGVSRTHAAIRVSGEGVSIIDLNSTNGTYLNGFVLRPHQPYKLRHGDEITLGKLTLQVGFVIPTKHAE
jgi:pSer/pThr/pTyr-binding forkhead associated (FHA) protein